MRWLSILSCLCLASAASAARPAAHVPSDPDQMLLVLAPAPADEDVAALLEHAARRGDRGALDRAARALERQADRLPRARVQVLRAWIAQHRHDFDAARVLLDARLADDPRDADARALRARILLTTGQLRRAAADCAALALGVDAARGLVCTAALQQARGQPGAGRPLVDRWLATAADADPQRPAALVLRAELRAATGDASGAEADWRLAAALAPDDVRVLASFARGLRQLGRPGDALAVLPDEPPTERLLLERALAAAAAGRGVEAAPLVERLRRLARLREQLGSPMEARDEAERLLLLEGEAAAALALASDNFARQREPEDVELLQRAALAAGDARALAPLHAWREAEQVEVTP
jgi:tetratricopeptide (TPR) repeat protein